MIYGYMIFFFYYFALFQMFADVLFEVQLFHSFFYPGIQVGTENALQTTSCPARPPTHVHRQTLTFRLKIRVGIQYSTHFPNQRTGYVLFISPLSSYAWTIVDLSNKQFAYKWLKVQKYAHSKLYIKSSVALKHWFVCVGGWVAALVCWYLHTAACALQPDLFLTQTTKNLTVLFFLSDEIGKLRVWLTHWTTERAREKCKNRVEKMSKKTSKKEKKRSSDPLWVVSFWCLCAELKTGTHAPVICVHCELFVLL